MTDPTDAEIVALAVSEGIKVRTGAGVAKLARAVLARWGQPAHSGEPVATVGSWTNGSYSRNYKITWHRDVPEGTKLYTAPQSVEREPLPPDELMRIIMEVEQQHNFLRGTTNWAAAVGRAIERAHGITKGGQHGPV